MTVSENVACVNLFFFSFNVVGQTKVKPYICSMPLRMDEGWNTIQSNLADFTRREYGIDYVETLLVQVHANCQLRRIYFSDPLCSEELPPEFKLYLPSQSPAQITIKLDSTCFSFAVNNHKSLLLQKA